MFDGIEVQAVIDGQHAEAQKDEGVTIIHQLDLSGPDSTETDGPKSVDLLVKRMRDNVRPLLVRHKFS